MMYEDAETETQKCKMQDMKKWHQTAGVKIARPEKRIKVN